MSAANLAEDSDWAEVIAVDPGGTSGWSVMQVHPEALVDADVSVLSNVEHWAHGQLSGDEDKQAKEFLDLIEAWPDAAVVVEGFILRQYRKDAELLAPVRIIAKLEFGMRWFLDGGPKPLFVQQPALAKSAVTDDRLKSWGFYVREGGEEHARDADRHALTFLRRAKEKPSLRAEAWPSLYGEES